MNSESPSPPTDNQQAGRRWIVGSDETILVTGAAGFIGARVVRALCLRGLKKIRCLVRSSSDLSGLESVLKAHPHCQVEILPGNLLSRADCSKAVASAPVVLHLVTGRGKSFPACFQNSVVATRNLLDAALAGHCLRRLVNVSSFAVYSNLSLRRGAVFDETCPLEDNLEERYDAYVYAKLKQDELVAEYQSRGSLPQVTVRPTVVFGPGRKTIPGVVGLDTFGFFMHLGGGNRLPLTYVDNCADAIVLAGLVSGVEGRTYNIVDDALPSSRYFLRRYKREVRRFRSVPAPYPLFYFFCYLWERYAQRSEGQLPPVFNRRFCAFHWKGHRFSNQALKNDLGWTPAVPMNEALDRYFEYQKNGRGGHA